MEAITTSPFSKVVQVGSRLVNSVTVFVRSIFAEYYYRNRLNEGELKSLSAKFVYDRTYSAKIENTFEYINELDSIGVESSLSPHLKTLRAIRTLYFVMNSFESYSSDVQSLSGKVKAILKNDMSEKLTRREIYLLHLITKVNKALEEGGLNLDHCPELKSKQELLAQDASALIANIKGSVHTDNRRIFTYRDDHYQETRNFEINFHRLRVLLRGGTETHTGLVYYSPERESQVSQITYIKHNFNSIRLIDLLISETFLLDCKDLLVNEEYLKDLWNENLHNEINTLWDDEIKKIHESESTHSIKNGTIIKYLAAVRFFGFAPRNSGTEVGDKDSQICSEFVVKTIRVSIDNLNKILRERYSKKNRIQLSDQTIFIRNPFEHLPEACYLPSDIKNALAPIARGSLSPYLDSILK